MKLLLVAVLALTFAVDAEACRSRKAVYAFRHAHPCPTTGKTRGACPGYVVDHIIPLCKHGRDRASNMQWQTIGDAKAKDRWECKP